MAGHATRDGELFRHPEELGHGVRLDVAGHELARREDGQEADAALLDPGQVQRLGRIISEVCIDRRPAEQPGLLAGLQHLRADIEALLLGLNGFDLILRGLPGAPLSATIQRRDVHDLPSHPRPAISVDQLLGIDGRLGVVAVRSLVPFGVQARQRVGEAVADGDHFTHGSVLTTARRCRGRGGRRSSVPSRPRPRHPFGWATVRLGSRPGWSSASRPPSAGTARGA
ncbi:hypothetical protein D3C86_1072670 [compost metagenome]